jgi:hypothetical protein
MVWSKSNFSSTSRVVALKPAMELRRFWAMCGASARSLSKSQRDVL